MAFIIYRHPEGISLNGKEYLLDDENNLMAFKTIDQAREFLLDEGFADEDIGESVFIDETETMRG